jgi:hypothetical protein
VEIFHRRGSRVRVQNGGPNTVATHHASEEEGIAVRLLDRVRGTSGFGASTGAGPGSFRWALDRARESAARAAAEPDPSGAGEGKPVLDVGDDRSLPSHASLEADLDAVMEKVARTGRSGLSIMISGAWMETGLTEETLVTTSGIRASRVRLRTWAMVSIRWRSAGTWFERPRFLAKRGAGVSSAVEPFPEVGDALEFAGMDLEPPNSVPIVLSPGASAALVRTAARALHLSGASEGAPVGRGWRLMDRPDLEGGLFGGRFDDTGHPCPAVRLADGRSTTGSLAGPGHRWRASFRDPPAVLPTNLVVPEGTDPMPDRGICLSDLRIHPLEPDRWALEALGIVLEGGKPAEIGGRCVLTARPGDLVRRCVGSTGPAVASYLGVTTPALIFDN